MDPDSCPVCRGTGWDDDPNETHGGWPCDHDVTSMQPRTAKWCGYCDARTDHTTLDHAARLGRDAFEDAPVW